MLAIKISMFWYGVLEVAQCRAWRCWWFDQHCSHRCCNHPHTAKTLPPLFVLLCDQCKRLLGEILGITSLFVQSVLYCSCKCCIHLHSPSCLHGSLLLQCCQCKRMLHKILESWWFPLHYIHRCCSHPHTSNDLHQSFPLHCSQCKASLWLVLEYYQCLMHYFL